MAVLTKNNYPTCSPLQIWQALLFPAIPYRFSNQYCVQLRLLNSEKYQLICKNLFVNFAKFL